MKLTAIALIIAQALVFAGCGSLIVTPRSAESLRNEPGFSWTQERSDGIVVYAQSGGGVESEAPRIAQQAVQSKQQVLAHLSLDEYPQTISVFAVDTRDDMEKLIGRRTNATTYHDSHSICLVWPRTGRSGLAHELTHVITMNVWGVPQRWINEGVAVDATGDWAGHDLHSVCASLQEQDRLPALRDVLQRFDTYPSAVSYPAAGSLVRIMRKRFGWAAVRAIWDGGHRVLPQATGMSQAQLESLWHDVLAAYHDSDVDYDPQRITPVDDR